MELDRDYRNGRALETNCGPRHNVVKTMLPLTMESGLNSGRM